MTIIYSPAILPGVNSQTTKQGISDYLNAQLSTSRKITCKRDSNSAAVDPWSTGTAFRVLSSTGAMGTVNGAIADLGTLNNQTVSLAADMFTGSAVLRIENASDATKWAMGSLGPSRAAQINAGIANPVQYDFEVDGNFTTTNGIAVRPGMAFSGPRWYPTGVGPAAPPKDDLMPHFAELYDCTGSSNGVLVGSCALDTRVDDFTLEHPRMAEQIGDAAYYQSSTGVIWGKHWFSPHMMLSAASNTLSGTVPLIELGILASYKTDTGWTTYPEADTYTKKTDIVFPHAHKWVIKNKLGGVITSITMHDGKPINDPSMMSGCGTGYNPSGYSTGRPLQPKWNIANILFWRNDEPALNTYGQHIYPGQNPLVYRATQARSPYTVLSCEPLISDGYSNNGSVNGLAGYLWSSKWPLGLLDGQWGNYDNNGFTAPADQIPNDPYFDGSGSTNYGYSHAAWLEGYGYEPGAFGGHNWYTAPGGPRHDRSPIPSVVAEYLTDPTGNRPHGLVPWHTMVTHWNMNYFNRSDHWFKDPRTGFLDTNFNKSYSWSEMGFYYSSGREQPGPKIIWLNTDQRAGTDVNYSFDAEGNNVWNAWGQDSLHDYATSAWGAISQKSPMMAMFAKCDWHMACMNHGALGDYGVRDFAWHMLHHVLMWIVASRHPQAISQTDVEARFGWVSDNFYNFVYKPTWEDMNPAPYNAGIRNLGQYITYDGGTPHMQGGGLAFYLGGALAFMKQSGFWAKHLAKGGRVKIFLEQMIKDYDRYAFGVLTKTNATIWSNWSWPSDYVFASGNNIPNDWTDLYNCRASDAVRAIRDQYGNVVWPFDPPPADLLHNADGTPRRDYDVSQWPFMQYVLIRNDFFPEYTHPDMAASVNFVINGLNAMKTQMEAWIAANPTGHAPDYIYCYAGVAPMRAPAVVGPI